MVGRGAIVGNEAVLADGASLDPGCHLGADAFLGPVARLLDRTRLPTSEPGTPAWVGDRTRICGNAVVCGGITVGADAVVGAGECVEDDVPDDGVWMGGRLVAKFEGKEWE